MAPCAQLGRLVIAAQAGDERAWEALFARLGPLLAATARRRGLDRAQQDDATQRTWLLAVERLGSLREPAAFVGWLATIARRECVNVIAECGREPAADPARSDATAPGDVHSAAEAAERRAALLRSLRRLPPRQRALVLAFVAAPGLTYDELARALRMPRGSVGPTRRRGLARLREDPGLAAAVLNR